MHAVQLGGSPSLRVEHLGGDALKYQLSLVGGIPTPYLLTRREALFQRKKRQKQYFLASICP